MCAHVSEEKEAMKIAIYMCIDDDDDDVVGSLTDERMFAPIEVLQAHKGPVLCFSVCVARNVLASAGRDSSIKVRMRVF